MLARLGWTILRALASEGVIKICKYCKDQMRPNTKFVKFVNIKLGQIRLTISGEANKQI